MSYPNSQDGPLTTNPKNGHYPKYQIHRIVDHTHWTEIERPIYAEATGEYWVLRLDPGKDPHAIPAMRAYCKSIESENPELASQIREYYSHLFQEPSPAQIGNQEVHKYPLGIEDIQTVLMPKGAKIISVQPQNGKPTIWAQVDSNLSPTELRYFLIVATGQKFEHDVIKDIHIGTCVIGSYVWHIYETQAFTEQ